MIRAEPADGAEVTHFKITDITGGTLFLNDGTTPIAANCFITFAQGNAGLKFTPAANSTPPDTSRCRPRPAPADAASAAAHVVADIIVTPVADTPSVTNATTSEDVQTTPAW